VSKPRRPDHAIELTRKVAFHECDPLGVAFHGRYFEWMDVARTALFASVDLDVPVVRDFGHRMYVVETRCRYMVPLRYGDAVQLTAWFSSVAPLIRVAYDLYNPDSGRWSARGFTSLATTDRDGQLLSATPDALLARLPSR
jgi:acyl-CoA thioester hydrolase